MYFLVLMYNVFCHSCAMAWEITAACQLPRPRIYVIRPFACMVWYCSFTGTTSIFYYGNDYTLNILNPVYWICMPIIRVTATGEYSMVFSIYLSAMEFVSFVSIRSELVCTWIRSVICVFHLEFS